MQKAAYYVVNYSGERKELKEESEGASFYFGTTQRTKDAADWVGSRPNGRWDSEMDDRVRVGWWGLPFRCRSSPANGGSRSDHPGPRAVHCKVAMSQLATKTYRKSQERKIGITSWTRSGCSYDPPMQEDTLDGNQRHCITVFRGAGLVYVCQIVVHWKGRQCDAMRCEVDWWGQQKGTRPWTIRLGSVDDEPGQPSLDTSRLVANSPPYDVIKLPQ